LEQTRQDPVLRLSQPQVEGGRPPSGWEARIHGDGSGLCLRGDDTGAEPLYVHAGERELTLSSDPVALLDDLSGRVIRPGVSPAGVSQFLHHALVPLPETVWEDVYFLATGDRCRVSVHGNLLELDFATDYPYLLERSTGDHRSDPAVLREAIRAAVERQLPAGESGFLMLSSGKDSSGLALGLADAGRTDFPCVTFVASGSDSEPVHASKLCGRLGLRHETVGLQLVGNAVEDLLREFFAASPLPCGDFAQIPYVLCVHQAGPGTTAVLDGSGNDAYMGYVPSSREILKQRLCIGHGRFARGLARAIGPDSGFNYFLRSPADATLPGRTFRVVDTEAFHPYDVDTGPYWRLLSREWGHLDEFEFRNSPIERHVDQAEILLKLRLAAAFAGQRPVLPFCDPDLIDYVFHLPESARFDRRTRTNKLLLRETLARYADYDAAAIGKGFFDFDGARFLLDHRDFALDEIGACALWNPSVRRLAEGWFRRLSRRPLLYHCLLPLLLLSGWHNHSRFLERASRPASVAGGEAP